MANIDPSECTGYVMYKPFKNQNTIVEVHVWTHDDPRKSRNLVYIAAGNTGERPVFDKAWEWAKTYREKNLVLRDSITGEIIVLY